MWRHNRHIIRRINARDVANLIPGFLIIGIITIDPHFHIGSVLDFAPIRFRC
jgi:hypothetical protein